MGTETREEANYFWDKENGGGGAVVSYTLYQAKTSSIWYAGEARPLSEYTSLNHKTTRRSSASMPADMFSRAVQIAVIALVCGAGAALAQVPQAANGIALLYDDRKVSDEDRAKLFTVVAGMVPEAKWTPVPVARGTDVRKLVDDYYDYFANGRFSAPLTTRALVEAIQRVNGVGTVIRTARTIKLPPLPVRANGDYRKPRALRVFNAETHGYALRQNQTVARLAATATVGDAKRLSRERDGSATQIVLPVVTAESAARIANEVPQSIMKLSTAPAAGDPKKVTIGMVTVELLLSPQPACPPVGDILDRSLFRAAQKKRVEDALAQHRSELLQLAGAFRLVLLDVGFESHHGSKVNQATRQVLAALGAGDLAGGIRTIDLYPVNEGARKLLADTLQEYMDAHIDPNPEDEVKQQFEKAKAWIQNSAAAPDKPTVSIPEVILRAIFWKYVTARSVVNMSFRFRAPATGPLLTMFASGLDAFAVVAVGNTVEAIEPGWVPQDAIALRPSFLNVTYGSEDGELGAQYTQVDESGARVPVMAPGCGFAGIGDSGASLASPYVAAAVWLRWLLDQAEHREGFIPKTFWRDALAATRPVPGLAHPVESGGLFDAPMLVAPPPGRHYILRRDQTVVPIENLKIRYSCKGPNGPVEQPAIASLPAEAQRETGALAVYADENGKLLLWLRLAPARTAGRGTSEKGCEVQAFEMTADSANGRINYDFSKLKTLADQVEFVAW